MKLNVADKTAYIYVTGEIGCDEQGYWEGYCLKNWQDDYTAALNAGCKEIVLRVNSPGGDLFEGFALHDAIRLSEVPVRCEVLGLCASAATLVAYACADVKIGEHSYMGLHEPFTYGQGGTVAELEKFLDDFRGVRERAFSVYVARTGRTMEEVLAELAETKMYAGAKAVELGWADAVLSTDEDLPEQNHPEGGDEVSPQARTMQGEEMHVTGAGPRMQAEDGGDVQQGGATESGEGSGAVEADAARADAPGDASAPGEVREAPGAEAGAETAGVPPVSVEPHEGDTDAGGVLAKFQAWMRGLAMRALRVGRAASEARGAGTDYRAAYEAAMASMHAAHRAERAAREAAAGEVAEVRAELAEAEKRLEAAPRAGVQVADLPAASDAVPGVVRDLRADFKRGGIDAVVRGRKRG